MTGIDRRLARLEREEQGGGEPIIVLFKTFYENRQGEIESTVARASIIGPAKQYEFLKMLDEEQLDEFRARVHERCLALYGRLPRDTEKHPKISTAQNSFTRSQDQSRPKADEAER